MNLLLPEYIFFLLSFFYFIWQDREKPRGGKGGQASADMLVKYSPRRWAGSQTRVLAYCNVYTEPDVLHPNPQRWHFWKLQLLHNHNVFKSRMIIFCFSDASSRLQWVHTCKARRDHRWWLIPSQDGTSDSSGGCFLDAIKLNTWSRWCSITLFYFPCLKLLVMEKHFRTIQVESLVKDSPLI